MTSTMFVKHQVKDFNAWKSVYDGLGEVRKQKGVTAASVHRDPQNKNTLIITHQFKDLKSATDFANSTELKSALERSGVNGKPEIWFSEDLEATPY